MNRIDNINLADIGVYIARGGDDTFLRFPERKEPAQNEWFEHDGLDVDLSSALFKPQKVQLDLCINATNISLFNQRLNALETILYGSGERQIYIGDFDKTYTARFTGISNYKHRGGLYRNAAKTGKLTADFILDNPTQVFTPDQLTLSGGRAPSYTKLNGVDLGDFGIIVHHLYDTAIPSGKPRQGIVEELYHLDGSIADTAFVPARESKQLELICTMVAAHRGHFWTNYTALFNHLRKLDALTIDVPNRPSIECYYQAMIDIKKKRPLGIAPRVSFTIKLKTL